MAKESDITRTKCLLRGVLVLAGASLALGGCQQGGNNEQSPVVIQPYQEPDRLTERESLEITKKNLQRVVDWLSSQNQDELQNLKEDLSKDLESLESGAGLLRPMSTLGPDYARVVLGGPVSGRDKTEYEIGLSVSKFSSGEFNVNEAALDILNAYRDLQSTSVSK